MGHQDAKRRTEIFWTRMGKKPAIKLPDFLFLSTFIASLSAYYFQRRVTGEKTGHWLNRLRRVGRVHALTYRAIPFHYGLPADTVNLVGVATTRPESAQKAAEEIGCPVWTANFHELLARPDIDLIDICTPNQMHEEIVLAAAQAGEHIYCEKPLSMNVAEGQHMRGTVQKAGLEHADDV